MSGKMKRKLVFWVCIVAALLVLAIVVQSPGGHTESIKDTMKDAVLHEDNRVSLFGLVEVSPAVISGFTVTGIVIAAAIIIRLVVIPKFKEIPGKFQMVLEMAVGYFENLAKGNSHHRNKFLGAYVFAAGAYIFIGTIFELLGLQAVTTTGASVAMPAPLADINGAIALGILSYGVIMSGGIASNGIKGVFLTLKDFSLPISMSFRLFGALLSGLLVTELVYYNVRTSIGLPVFVGTMFTILHALIQTYVLTMLTTIFYGEVSEVKPKKMKTKNLTYDNGKELHEKT